MSSTSLTYLPANGSRCCVANDSSPCIGTVHIMIQQDRRHVIISISWFRLPFFFSIMNVLIIIRTFSSRLASGIVWYKQTLCDSFQLIAFSRMDVVERCVTKSSCLVFTQWFVHSISSHLSSKEINSALLVVDICEQMVVVYIYIFSSSCAAQVLVQFLSVHSMLSSCADLQTQHVGSPLYGL